jgi:hypothetical protein
VDICVDNALSFQKKRNETTGCTAVPATQAKAARADSPGIVLIWFAAAIWFVAVGRLGDQLRAKEDSAPTMRICHRRRPDAILWLAHRPDSPALLPRWSATT